MKGNAKGALDGTDETSSEIPEPKADERQILRAFTCEEVSLTT